MKGLTDRRIAWVLFAVGLLSLLLTEKPVGFGRDESVYFHAAESHGRWFQLLVTSPSEAVKDEAITRHFDFNHEHPALMKNLFGISFVVLHEKLGLLRPAAAFRFPAFVFAAWMLPLIFLLSRRLWGQAASIFAAVSFFLVPRQFFHSHLACFDVPIATMWVLTVFCFVEALEKRADRVMDEVRAALARSMFPPFGRTVVYELANSIDNVLDLTEDAAQSLHLYHVTRVTPEAIRLAELALDSARRLQLAIGGLERMQAPQQMLRWCGEVDELESQADHVMRAAMSRLFREEPDARQMVKLKAVYELLESLTDSCKSVGSMIESLVLKHG